MTDGNASTHADTVSTLLGDERSKELADSPTTELARSADAVPKASGGVLPGGEGSDDEPPQLVDDRFLELVLSGAKMLVVVVYIGAVITFTTLTLGFVLLVFGASPEAPFVEWAYRSTEEAMKPFRGMFPVHEIDGRSVFDPSLLFAAALYGFVAIGLHAIVGYLSALARRLHRQAGHGDS